MAYYYMKASASFVGTEKEWVFQAYDEEEVEGYSELAYQHIEGYEDPDDYEMENGIEYEYDYHSEEISKEQYEEYVKNGVEAV